MTSDNEAGTSLRNTARQVLAPVVSALVTGVADAVPTNPGWPGWLHWTRWIGIGRLSYRTVVIGMNIVIAWAILGGTYGSLIDKGEDTVGWGSLFFVSALAAIPVILRTWHPVAAWRVLLIPVVWVGSQEWITDPYVGGGAIAMILCLFSVAARAPREVALGAGIVSVAGAWLIDVRTAPGASLLIVVPLLIGYLVRERRLSRAELAEQERRHQDVEAVLTERQRIARELHDVVAHHMSMIAIQAEAAPYKVTAVPEETRADLAEIRATAVEALTEMRRILGVLRSEDGMQTAPQPGLDRLDELVANAESTGLRVTAKTVGDARPLAPGVGLTAYRILQEALSNAMRHAPGSEVSIEVEYLPAAVRLGVVNGPSGRPAPDPTPGGHGLIGMRERAGMLGGELSAGPTPGGGFAVAATLPTKEVG